MFEDGLTGELLFEDPHTLAKYLDDISSEVEASYVHRKADQIIANMDTIDQELVFEITKKESQLKLLVDFVGILMDKSQDKIQSQVDEIAKLETELKEALEERAGTNLELEILKQNFESFQVKYKTLETNFLELEDKYDKERLAANKKKMEVQALSTMKDKYTEVKDEERRRTVINMKLSEEKSIMEARIAIQREENKRLKEEVKVKDLDIEALQKELEETLRVSIQLEKQSKDYESEREACISEIQSLREKLEEATSKCEVFEQELSIARTTSRNTASVREETPESASDNFNLKITNLTSNGYVKARSKTIGRDSFQFSGDTYIDDRGIGLNSHFGNTDDMPAEQYDNIRFSITREHTREFTSFIGRKSRLFPMEAITSDSHRKNEEIDQTIQNSNASTEAPSKVEIEKAAVVLERPSEVDTPKAEINSASTSDTIAPTSNVVTAPVKEIADKEPPAKENQSKDKKLVLEPGKRKDILEEFYLLTWQSVLLNSPNFNDIAGWVDSTNIYNEITKEGIPFFQWYSWLNNKIQEVYKSHLLPEIRERRASTIRSRRATKV